MKEKAKENLTAAINKLGKIFPKLGISKSTSDIINDIEAGGYTKDREGALSTSENGPECAEAIVRQYISDRVIAELTKNDGPYKNLMDALKNLTGCLGIDDFNIRTLKIDYKEEGLLEQFTNLFSLSKKADPKETIFQEHFLPEIKKFLNNFYIQLTYHFVNFVKNKNLRINSSVATNLFRNTPEFKELALDANLKKLQEEVDLKKITDGINSVAGGLGGLLDGFHDGLVNLDQAVRALESIIPAMSSSINTMNSLNNIYEPMKNYSQKLGEPLLPNIKEKISLNLDRESDDRLIIRVADADIAEAAAEPLKSLEVAENDLQKWVDGINALVTAIDEKINHLSNGFKDLYKEFAKIEAAIPEPIKKASKNDIENVFDGFKSGSSNNLDGLVELIEKFYTGE